jgi:hypothetical protein
LDEEGEGLKLVIGAVSTLKEGRDEADATGTGAATAIAV